MIIINPIINFILKLIKGEAWVRHIERTKLENTDFTILRFYDFSLCRIFDFPKSSTFTKVVIVARRSREDAICSSTGQECGRRDGRGCAEGSKYQARLRGDTRSLPPRERRGVAEGYRKVFSQRF
jgi:hypothetical protein